MSKKNKIDPAQEQTTVQEGAEQAKNANKQTPETDAQLAENKKYKYIITNRKVRKEDRKRRFVIILLIILLIALLLGGLVYGVLSFITYNNFKVMIDKEGGNTFSLSYNSSFTNPTQVLSLGGPKFMDNVTMMDLYQKIPEFEAAEGTYLGEYGVNIKYLAATFYLKNITSTTQVFTESIELGDVTKDVDAAVRIMLIRNGERTVYAKAKDGAGTPEEVVPGQYFTSAGVVHALDPTWMTVPFVSPKHAFYNAGVRIAPGEMIKYTLVIWLEGWDPECVDARLGGTIKIEVHFTQTEG